MKAKNQIRLKFRKQTVKYTKSKKNSAGKRQNEYEHAVHLFGWTAFCFVNTAIQWRSEPILPAVWYSAAWFPAVWYSVGSCTAVQIAYNGNWKTKRAMQGCIYKKSCERFLVFIKRHEIQQNAKRIQEKVNEIRLRRIKLALSGLKSGQWDS